MTAWVLAGGWTLTFREHIAVRWITGFGRLPNPAGRMPVLPAIDLEAAGFPREECGYLLARTSGRARIEGTRSNRMAGSRIRRLIQTARQLERSPGFPGFWRPASRPLEKPRAIQECLTRGFDEA